MMVRSLLMLVMLIMVTLSIAGKDKFSSAGVICHFSPKDNKRGREEVSLREAIIKINPLAELGMPIW